LLCKAAAPLLSKLLIINTFFVARGLSGAYKHYDNLQQVTSVNIDEIMIVYV